MTHEDEKFDGRMHGPQDAPEAKDGLGLRLLHMVLIWFMLQLSLTVLGVVTLVQFVVTLVNAGAPNPRLAEFGESLGIWMAKAARYLVAASEVKPWPWTELD
jgi:hypothetical protein